MDINQHHETDFRGHVCLPRHGRDSWRKPSQITDPAARARRITRTSYVGIGANLLLAGFKAAVGLLSNSVAIVLDAVNNLTDALSSVNFDTDYTD